ncbi:hypothetical protein PF002_g11650 [Phytophthora fragariae]|uniref:Multiple inositol polyphosphate phosphatase 1 n=2 Tax=Phytophthora fragariae TaxID=53985 RepID=A0A6A3ZE00_9STRA|nr:hypothetical protein PF002_g11650 [Phytophthora fragariae]
MTMYWDQRGATSELLLSNARVTGVQASDLELLQIQQVSRHGSRFPTDNTMREIAELVYRLQANYSSVLPQWLQEYSLPYNLTVAGVLSSTGVDELAAYGKRTRTSVGSAIPTAYNEKQFVLAHTFKARLRAHFSTILTTFATSNTPREGSVHSLLRYMRPLPVGTHLKTQLNLPDSADLSVVDVRAAFAACAFDIMVYGVTNQWCSLMDQTFLNRLDYAEDLEAFYEQGAGYKINYEMAAVLLQVDFILVRIRN